MRVFYYTTCPTGKRADDPRPMVGGEGVRAWTAGSSKIQLSPLFRFAGCDFLADGGARRLALVRRDGQSALFHSAPGASDEVNRVGAAFTHAVVELPPDFDPLVAIRTWGSPDWQTGYPPDADVTLADAPAVPAPGPLDDDGLAAFLADTKNFELSRYVLAAALAPTPPAKTYLYAPADVVAWAVYAALRAAPTAVRREFTFSTYEKSPLDFPARLVGSWGDTRENDLPRSCYQAPNGAINLTGGRAGARFESMYAELALRWLAGGAPERVDQFLARADGLGVTAGVPLGDLAVLLHSPESLTPDIVSRLLTDRQTAREVVASEPATAAVLEWAADLTRPRSDLLTALLQAAGPGPAREAVVRRLEDAALAAAGATPNRLEHALGLLRQVDSGRERGFGCTAVERLDPAAIPWAARKVLLPRVHDGFATESVAPSARVRAWLDVGSSQLTELLRDLRLPLMWQTAAVAATARREAVTDTFVVAWLADRSERLRDVFRELAADPDRHLAAAFDRAPLRPLFQAFDDGQSVPPRVVDRVLTDKQVTRELLANRAVIERLRADADALNRVVREAVADDQPGPLLKPELLAAVGKETVARAVADAGWAALRAGTLTAAHCAFEKVLSKLVATAPLLDRVGAVNISEFPAGSQWYLINSLLAQGKSGEDRIAAWLPTLKAAEQSRVLGDPQPSDDLKHRTLQAYFAALNRAPAELEGEQVSVAVAVAGMKWLLGQGAGGAAAAERVLDGQAGCRSREGALWDELERAAGTAPTLWLLADRYLGLRLNRIAHDPVAEINFAIPVLKSLGVTDNVRRLADELLNRSKPFEKGSREEKFFAEVDAVANRGKGGPLSAGALTHIRYLLARLKRPAEGADMFEWFRKLLAAFHPSTDGLVGQQQRHAAEELGQSLLTYRADPRLADWLHKNLDVSKELRWTRAQLLAAALRWVKESGRLDSFLGEATAVTACLAVCLGVPARVGGSRAAAAGGVDGNMQEILDALCRAVYATGREYAFFELFRKTSEWSGDEVGRLIGGYRRASEGGSDHHAAPDTALRGESAPEQRSLLRRGWDWLNSK